MRGSRPAVMMAGEEREGDGAGRVGGGRVPPCGSESPAVESLADKSATGSSRGLGSCIVRGAVSEGVAGARLSCGRPGQDRRWSREEGRVITSL